MVGVGAFQRAAASIPATSSTPSPPSPQAPMPTIKGSQMPDSCMPLLRVAVPALVISGDADGSCPPAALQSTLRVAGSPDVRLVVSQVRCWFSHGGGGGGGGWLQFALLACRSQWLKKPPLLNSHLTLATNHPPTQHQGVTGSFQPPATGDATSDAAAINPALRSILIANALQFINALAADKLSECSLSRAKKAEDGPPGAAAVAALQAAHVRMQEEDALAYAAVRVVGWVGGWLSGVLKQQQLSKAFHPPPTHYCYAGSCIAAAIGGRGPACSSSSSSNRGRGSSISSISISISSISSISRRGEARPAASAAAASRRIVKRGLVGRGPCAFVCAALSLIDRLQ